MSRFRPIHRLAVQALALSAPAAGTDFDRSVPVVIAGIDDERGVHVARTMARHGIETIGIAKRAGTAGTRTRLCNRIEVADTDSEELIDKLVELGPGFGRKAVLIPGYDTAVSVISEHRDRLRDHYLFALPDEATVDLLRDKSQFYEYAAGQGFAVPKTIILTDKSELDSAVEQMRFPCVLKPNDSKSPAWRAHTHVKAFEVADEAELRELFALHLEPAETFVLQQLVKGTDADVHTCDGYYSVTTEPLIEFTTRKLRQWPVYFGVGTLAEEIHHDVVKDAAVKLLKPLDFHGICSLEMKRDAVDGEFYIIEANIGRPSGRAAHIEGCGVEMLLTIYCELLGLPLPTERVQPYEGRKWINVRRDFMSAFTYWRAGELSLGDWYRSLKGITSYAMVSRKDPVPFAADIWQTLRRTGPALLGR